MSATFAALEKRTNAAVVAHLSNRIATVASLSLEFPATFLDAGAEQLDGLVESTEPRLQVSLADAGPLPMATVVDLVNPATLETSSYVVTGSTPDGAGFVLYALREA